MRTTTLVRAALPAVLACGLIAPAAPVPKTPPPPPVTETDLKASTENLKQLGIAFHACHDEIGTMPADITDKDGKPLLSWRVAILPLIEEANLHKQFRLDEPWDSENNKKLVEKMPKTYAPVRVKAKEGETFYQVFTGDKALFGPKKKVRLPASIPDGMSNTGMVFEAGEPVVWSKPADLPFNEKELPKLGGLFDGQFHVAMCDGSVRRIKKGADEAELKKLIMPADGLVIDFTKLDP